MRQRIELASAPRFGGRCVCCSADTNGRTQDYEVVDRPGPVLRATPVAMPVCGNCAGHALVSHFASLMQACMLAIGAIAIGLGITYLRERPDDAFLYGTIVVGVVLMAAAIAWLMTVSRRDARARRRGHHPNLAFSVARGRTLLDSDNEELVVDLLARNPDARRLPTPLLWRRKSPVPIARVNRR
jgi:hypothetical protein